MSLPVKLTTSIVLGAFVVSAASAHQCYTNTPDNLVSGAHRYCGQSEFSALLADKGSNQPMTPRDSNLVEIVNSGSTNTAGFDIKVEASGSVLWSFTGTVSAKLTAKMGADGGQQQIDAQLAKQLFADIEAAMPFSQYPNRGCAKSRSFGYTLKVHYKGQESPDLSCPLDDPKLIAVNNDLNQILDKLKLSGQLPRR